MISIRLFGQVEVLNARGDAVAELLRRPKRIALLSYLAAAGPTGFHRRDKLIGLFWAEKSQDKARAALSQALFVLRSELGKDTVVSRGDEEVGLSEGSVSVDARLFKSAVASSAYEDARQLYRGPFLDGLYVSDAPEFERWVELERTSYRQDAVASALQQVKWLEEQGKYLKAVECARWAGSVAPADEVVVRRLIKLLDAHGDRATALREYEDFARVFEEECGLEPSPETKALVERIRTRQTPVLLDTDANIVDVDREEPNGVGGATSETVEVEPEDPDRVQESRLTEALREQYRIERRIDAGGMAIVYQAHDLKHDRNVAIKVLRAALAETIGVDRFLREIRLEASLHHPNIVSLYDSGEADGIPYYVMPYFASGSLRDLLDKDRHLTIETAIRITAEVAGALTAAHERGVLHRDIKPSNILLEAGHAVVSDFGIARAIDKAGGERLTQGSIAIGTPGYMSPEQGTGNEDLDARSDTYSLACVSYEMLAGEMVFDGPSARAIIAKHIGMPPPLITTLRPSVPKAVERVILRALEKVPADRYDSAAAFARALREAKDVPLELAPRPEPQPPVRKSAFWAALAVAVLAVFGMAWGGPKIVDRIRGVGGESPDTTRYAILPFTYGSGVEQPLNDVQMLNDALGRWAGLSVIAQFEVNDAIREGGLSTASTADAARIARGLGAGRYIRGEATIQGEDSLRVEAVLFATDGGRIAEHAVRVPRNLVGAQTQIAQLADALLFRGSPPGDAPSEMTTFTLPARQAFERGQRAVDEWDLPQADSAFSEAAAFDPGYAQAHMWVALARSWSGAERASWSISVQQAALGMEQMSDRDRRITAALQAEARGDLGEACPMWERITDGQPNEFEGWYGYAVCLQRDTAVLPDSTSPSGWRFRTSWHHAFKMFQRAFELRPSILTSFRAGSYFALRDLFMAGGNAYRGGRAGPPEITRFAADPEWLGDTLALVPHPAESLIRLPRPESGEVALRKQREIVRDIAIAWTASSSDDSNALEALAISLALLGDPSAVDTLRRAQSMAKHPADRFRFSVSEVWMQLAFAAPWNEEGLYQARQLADALLGEWPASDAADPWLICGLASLTGRAALAAAVAREPRVAQELGTPPTLRETAPALWAYSALGGPQDSIAQLEQRVLTAIEETLLQPERKAARARWLSWAATLAFPNFQFVSLLDLAGADDYVLDMQAAWVARDTLAVKQRFDEIRAFRRHLPSANVTIDGLYPEAGLLYAIGDVEEAAAWLDPALYSLPQMAPDVLASPARAASLVRAMALRARIAEQLGDFETSRRWANAVVTLWSDADQFLQPLVREMRELGR